MNKVYKAQILFTILGSLIFLSCEKNDTGLPVDGDGNVYDTIAIGTQVWLAENLKTTKFNNGVSIPLVIDSDEWATMSSSAYCWYDNHPDFKNTYGALYNWYAVNSTTLCPVGYHVPTKDEWTTLINYLGGDKVAGGKLKEAGLLHWQSPNTGATNESGFTALASGYRHSNGSSYSIGDYGEWWSSTQSIESEKHAYYFSVYYMSSWLTAGLSGKKAGKSIRCIKDNP